MAEAVPKPAFVDNPIMAGAFASFMDWAFRQADCRAEFERATGTPRYSPPRNGLERMIDQACGLTEEAYIAAFVPWAIRELWGEEGDPRMES